MNDVNMVVISGVLADTPRQVATQKGDIGASFRLKVMREYKGREFSCFVTCKHFGDGAATVLASTQGTPLIVTGKLDVESWDDRNGNKRYETVVKVDTVAGYQPPAGGSCQQSQQPQQGRQWYGGQQQNYSRPQYGQQQQHQYAQPQHPQQPPQNAEPQEDTTPF